MEPNGDVETVVSDVEEDEDAPLTRLQSSMDSASAAAVTSTAPARESR
jgi:hypothetical protein